MYFVHKKETRPKFSTYEHFLKSAPDWSTELFKDQKAHENFKEIFLQIDLKLVKQLELKKTIFPHWHDIYNAYKLSTFRNTKVVIVGQDPYHGINQAHGLSFSVKKGIRLPPSLQNIYKEISADLNLTLPNNGELTSWASQGVLLLNTILTVEMGTPLAHKNIGWEKLTSETISMLGREKENMVFLLWGANARSFAKILDKSKHLILEANHPSPLSAHRGFLGCKHFSKTNEYLVSKNLDPINWKL